MVSFNYGPAEVFIVRYVGEFPDSRVLEALADLVSNDTVRLLDILIAHRDEQGQVRVLEIDDIPPEHIGQDLALEARGIAGNDDIDEIAANLQAGTSAAIAVIEQRWARTLAERFADSGAELLQTVRVPAPELNAIAAAAHIE